MSLAGLGRPASSTFARPQTSGSAVFDNEWTRQLTSDGRVYYYNRSTNASQWHLPNDLWRPQCLTKSKSACALLTRKINRVEDVFARRPFYLPAVGSRPSSCVRMSRPQSSASMGLQSSTSMADTMCSRMSNPLMMPGDARGCRKVDCVTEGFIQTEEDESETVEDESADSREPVNLITSSVLRVCIKSARNLRNGDLGLDRTDLSDPYVTCELQGRPETKFQTPVIIDDLDPVWEYEGTIARHVTGSALHFRVYDEDPVEEFTKSLNYTDDLLGHATLLIAEALAKRGPRELRLKDSGKDVSGKTIKSYLSVEVDPCTAWPDLVGMDKDEAAELLEQARPDLSVELYEDLVGDETFSVQSWDPATAMQGYHKNYFGASLTDLLRFQKGDLIEVFPNLRLVGGRLIGDRREGRRYTVEKVGGGAGSRATIRGVMVSYVFVQEESLGMVVVDGMQWRRKPKGPSPGLHPSRVCIFYDPATDEVSKLPRTG